MESMNGKIAIITGANSGMGLATAIALAKQGVKVIMACRSFERGNAALAAAKSASGSNSLELMLCNLASFSSIRDFAASFRERYDQLDLLINNAGVVALKRETTEDGFELMLGVNHLGHFLLTMELLQQLEKSPQGRIINLSSAAYKAGRFHFADPNLTSSFNVVKGYAQSKLCNIMFTTELARRLVNTNIAVNAVHPGAVSTNLGVNRETGFGKSIYKVLRPFFQTPEEGARTAIYLATSSDAGHVTGQYFVNCKPVSLSKRAVRTDEALRLWEWSVSNCTT